MARIAGVDLPNNKRGEIALTSIYGIGRPRAVEILAKAGLDVNTKPSDWSDDQTRAIRRLIEEEYRASGQTLPRDTTEIVHA